MKYAELVRKQDAELADLHQQLAEARAEVEVANKIRDEHEAMAQRALSEAHVARLGSKMVNHELERAQKDGARWYHELAAQAAELATLRKEKETAVADAWNSIVSTTCNKCGNYVAIEVSEELATLRERLAASERIIGSNGMLRVGVVEIVDAQCDGKYEVENSDTGDVLGVEDDDGEVEARLFDDWYEAYQAAIAAGWIPPSTKGEG